MKSPLNMIIILFELKMTNVHSTVTYFRLLLMLMLRNSSCGCCLFQSCVCVCDTLYSHTPNFEKSLFCLLSSSNSSVCSLVLFCFFVFIKMNGAVENYEPREKTLNLYFFLLSQCSSSETKICVSRADTHTHTRTHIINII